MTPEETNSYIAEHIMGEPMPPLPGDEEWEALFSDELNGCPLESPGGNWRCRVLESVHDVPFWEPLPFMTDDASAFKLVDRLCKEWEHFYLCKGNGWGAEFRTVHCIFKTNAPTEIPDTWEETTGTEWGQARTEAICNAAKKAHEMRKK